MKSPLATSVILVLVFLASACSSGAPDGAAVMSSTVDRSTVLTAEADDASPTSTIRPDVTTDVAATPADADSAKDLAGTSSTTVTTSTTAVPSGSSTSEAAVSDDGGDVSTDPEEGESVAEETRSNDALIPDQTSSVPPSTTAAPTTAAPTTTSVTTLSTTTRPTTTTTTGPTSTTSGVAPTSTTSEPLTTTSSRPAPTTTTIRPSPVDTSTFPRSPVVRSGAEMLVDSGFAGLEGKRIGIIVNHVSKVDRTHLIDVFDRAPEVELVAIFGPEHGVRGTADAGEKVSDDLDAQTGTPILSLYGKTRKPTAEMLEGIDVLVFDLQDVGTRFYTYISTMGLAMQAAAAADIEFVVLDRPNPLGGTDTAGFTRLAAQDSFIGQYPIPATYALTAGELAQAIKGERWMSGLDGLDLRVVQLDGWKRNMLWPDTGMPWVGPSPGLPTFESALAYPGTVLLEATTVSYGTGTYHPFSTLGAPWVDKTDLANDLNSRGLPGVWFLPLSYTPRVIEGLSVRPRLEGELIHGVRYVFTDYRAFDPVRTGVHLLDALRIQADANDIDGWIDRPKTFDLLSGNPTLRRMVLNGDDPDKIAATWAADNRRFSSVHSRYLLYR